MNVCIYVYMCVNICSLTEEKPKSGYKSSPYNISKTGSILKDGT